MNLSAQVKTYLKVYVALLALLATTVGAIYINLGAFNIVLTMAIAMAKALLVAFFFMHIKTSARVVWTYSLLGLLWLSFLIGGTMTDVLTRR